MDTANEASPPDGRSRAERFCDGLVRHRVLLLALWIIHAVALHLLVIGYATSDGLSYRGVPPIEWTQHHGFNAGKYPAWPYAGNVPFLELAHVPFLHLFGLRGFLIGFPLLVFPLAVAAIYALVREVTSDVRAATFGGLAFAALPMMNTQPFAGYVDFAACGLMAFFLYALLRVRTAPRWGLAFARLAIATALFSMSRIQAPYVVIITVPVVSWWLLVERRGLRVRIARPRLLALVLAAVALGLVPAIAVQVWKYLTFGSPTFPLQFQVFGVRLGPGVPLEHYYTYVGIDSGGWAKARSFVRGWLFSPSVGGFYDSRNLGGGLVMAIALVASPWFVRRASRLEIGLVGLGLALSLLAGDFVHPRYAYGLCIALILVIARALPAMASSARTRTAFAVLCALLLAHGLRPIHDAVQIATGRYGWNRLDVTGSPLFLPSARAMSPWPDVDGRVVIIGYPARFHEVPIFGRGLSNQIVGVVDGPAVGADCGGLAHFVAADPATLFHDPGDTTRSCARTCALASADGSCLAYRLP
jgi:hypothetical protein